MSDRKWAVVAFIGFIILCIVYVNNAPKEGRPKDFAYGSFYEPVIKSQDENAAEVYKSLVGTKGLECPVVELSRSYDDLAYITNYYQVYQSNNEYNIVNFFLKMNDLENSSRNPNPSSINDIKDVLGVGNDIMNSVEAINIMNTFCDSNSDEPEYFYDEIIAPFAFSFDSINTTNQNNELAIINKKGNCKIVFNNVANWYCAGPVGTVQTVVDSGNASGSEWINHQHFTVIGKSSNSSVKGGDAGQVIGYIGENTTVSIYKLDGNNWVQISIKDWITGN